jgi:hypothetical protein
VFRLCRPRGGAPSGGGALTVPCFVSRAPVGYRRTALMPMLFSMGG